MKQRESGVELLRIIAMLMILASHASIGAFNGHLPSHQECVADSTISFLRFEFGALSVLGVNIFVLISGWFGIRLSFKGISNLLFQVIFYRLFIGLIFFVLGDVSFKDFTILLVPGYGDWFVRCYLILAFIAPILNISFTKDHNWLFAVIILSLSVQTIFGWLLPLWNDYSYGYSVISFINLYLLGRMLNNIFTVIGNQLIIRPVNFIFCILLLIGAGEFVISRLINNEYLVGLLEMYSMSYLSPINILFAILLLFSFVRFKLYSKFVNRIAMSAFAVYLIHENPLVRPIYRNIALSIFQTASPLCIFCGLILLISLTYIVCTLVDQIRLLIWKQMIKIGIIERMNEYIKNIFSRFLKYVFKSSIFNHSCCL